MAVTLSGTVSDVVAGSASFTGADQSTPEDTAGGSGACGTSDPHLQSVTPASADSYIFAVLVDDEISIGQLSLTAPSGLQQWEIDMGSFMAAAATVDATSTDTHLVSWNPAFSRDYCLAAVSVKAVVAAAAAAATPNSVIFFDSDE